MSAQRSLTTDHLMQVHDLGRGFVSLRGRLYQASVPDQMLRAQWAVEWAIKEGRINSDHGLIVLGSGVAGVSAAIHAVRSELQIPVVIVDQNARPFHLQRRKNTREIDPMGYHWPHTCHQQGYIENAPLPVWPSVASVAVAAWGKHWGRIRRQSRGQLRQFWSERITRQSLKFVDDQRLWSLTLSNGEAIHGALVIDCRGFAKEVGRFRSKSPYNNHRSIPFWHNDTLLASDLGLKGQPPRVLIAGSGDGGLQDLTRAATGLTATNLLRDLCPLLPEEFTRRVLELEMAAGRQLQLAGARRKIQTAILDELHHGFVRAVDACLEHPAQGAAIEARLKDLIRPPFLSPDRADGEIRLIYRGNSFSRCYAASHIAALFLAAVAPGIILHSGAEVAWVNTSRTRDATNPLSYIGVPSKVRIKTGAGRQTLPGRFNLVINRGGVAGHDQTRECPEHDTAFPPNQLPQSHLLMPFTHPFWRLFQGRPHPGGESQATGAGS